MALLSELLKHDPKLRACLVSDSAHVFEGAVGSHVAKIQTALLVLDGLAIDKGELAAKRYGPSTASAVLAFKTKRNIINRGYQTKPDRIVGKMTIAALDRELLQKQEPLCTPQKPYCGNDRSVSGGSRATPPAPGASMPHLLIATAFGAAGAPAVVPTRSGSAGGSPPTAMALALERVNDAKDWVTSTRSDLRRVIDFWPSQPAGTRDKIWRHFGMPADFPLAGPISQVSSLLDFVIEIDKVYEKVLGNLGAANSVFRDANPPWFPEPTVPAFTIDDDRAPGDPPKNAQWPNGMYFQPQYVPLGPKKKTEIAVHECVHFIDTDKFQDKAQPGTAQYGKLWPDARLRNAWSYSTFVLDCKFSKSMPLDPNE